MQPETRSTLADKGIPAQHSFPTLSGEGAITCRTGTAWSSGRRWLK
jgi:hypothetical protein